MPKADKFPPFHGKAIAGVSLDPSLVVEDIAEALSAGKDDGHWILAQLRNRDRGVEPVAVSDHRHGRSSLHAKTGPKPVRKPEGPVPPRLRNLTGLDCWRVKT